MTRAVMRKIALAAALGGMALSAPAGAQMFSDGYEFLKAVKERDGDAVTNALNEPGSTLINTRDISSGETAMHIVTERRDVTWIRFLAQRGANPNVKDKKGTAPIQLAVRLGFVEGVEALIKAGAEVDVTDVAGETPLIAAVHRRDTALIRLLLANGANPDRTDNSGRTARDYATLAQGNRAMVEEFTRADEERAGKGQDKDYGPSI
ncbi:ankyrin repeat domain-containing protein [Altererythrobacter arenosus]|uniref:Ankyrin repeat domain-containing protein n=1 Tax=Altererythrobacter arenosus TaxID=3032592 RepID=A0ABY8FT64_9SPHN|nr:ankyrin repeat domain-containing protein [Altererythrobacter sp. CAU 1644]WFL78206.1 ankyrin repeat domain-containing protein [Altererythrobacter sp. CAU 1644]